MNYEMKSKLEGLGRGNGGGDDVTQSLFRGTSCVGEPQESALRSLQTRDLRLFTDIVNTAEDATFPLPADHWINRELEDRSGKTLLLEAISLHLHDYVDTLLRAGARADLYSQELGTAPIHEAVRSGDLKCVKLLLGGGGNNRAGVNQGDKAGRTALHHAVDNKDMDIIDHLLSVRDIEVDVKDKKGSQTALYLAVKSKHPQIMEMLIENGASIDNVCFGKSIHQHILEKMPGFDISSIKIKRAPLVRQDSNSVLGKLAELIDLATHRNVNQESLDEGVLSEFKSLVIQCDSKSLNTFTSSGYTLLQKCSTGNLDQFADSLLTEGVDPNHCSDESSSPVHLAAFRGNSAVLKVLKSYHADFTIVSLSTRETVLHKVLKKDDAFSEENLEKSLKIILSDDDDGFKSQINRIINRKDLLGNTALHYATQRWSEDIVRLLLERGANIGIKNKWDEVPINKIPSSTMESFLDEHCLQSSNNVNHEDFEVTFRYNFLAPPVEALPEDVQGPLSDELEAADKLSEKYGDRRFALPETESLWYMGQSKEHRHLLKHPVITSFLWCKWTRIRKFVNRNMRFYMFFVMILTWFIFENYGGRRLKSQVTGTIPAFYGLFIVFTVMMVFLVTRDWMADIKDVLRREHMMITPAGSLSWVKMAASNWLEVIFLVGLGLVLALGVPSLWPLLTVLLVLLAGREMFQMSVSLRRYFLTLENWVEMAMVALVSVLLFVKDEGNFDLKRHLGGICLLLSWGELITFVAKHPRLTRYNVYVTMFFNVLQTFAYFLLWYGFYIFAFSMGFYIMLHKDEIDTHSSNTTNITPDLKQEEEGLQTFFNNPFLTFVKTCTMFVGELEFSDIPIDLDSDLMPLSYLYFLSFVILIVVVLMNLLNGLAVSDIREIRERAEIVAYLSIVDTVSYAESLLLGDPFDFLTNVPAIRMMMSVPSLSCCRQVYRSRMARRLLQRLTGAHGILLFYNYLPDKCLRVKPNENSNNCVKIENLTSDILEAARRIIIRKEKSGHETSVTSLEVENKFAGLTLANELLKQKVTRLEQKIDEQNHKLDLILTKL